MMASFQRCLIVARRIFLDRQLQIAVRYPQQCYFIVTSAGTLATVNQQTKDEVKDATKNDTSIPDFSTLAKYRFVYPEFLPDPNVEYRNLVREKLERMDMMKRRTAIHIPEFYVGSIMAVTASDHYAPGRLNRFLGICIMRSETGLRASFTLRNVIDNQGVEIMYHLYNPTIQKIDVLKLEKRLDEHLLYLRDALPEYSTFPLDMEYQHHPEGAPVPVNPIKVKLKPKPWYCRWERMNLNGVQDLGLHERFYERAKELATPWERYDLMKEYRCLVPEEEQEPIWQEVHEHRKAVEKLHKKVHLKKFLVEPKKF